jgi:hypothetical protein
MSSRALQGGELWHGRVVGRMALTASLIAGPALVAFPVLINAGFSIGGLVGLLWSPLALMACLFSILLAVISLAISSQHLALRLAPLIIVVFSLFFFFFGRIPEHVQDWNFDSRLDRRMQVVRMVERGELTGGAVGNCDCWYIELPEGYQRLSSGGRVLVSRHRGGFSVLFFVAHTGMFPDENYSAFIYRSDGDRPGNGEEDATGFTEVDLIKAHWYFVKHV